MGLIYLAAEIFRLVKNGGHIFSVESAFFWEPSTHRSLAVALEALRPASEGLSASSFGRILGLITSPKSHSSRHQPPQFASQHEKKSRGLNRSLSDKMFRQKKATISINTSTRCGAAPLSVIMFTRIQRFLRPKSLTIKKRKSF